MKARSLFVMAASALLLSASLYAADKADLEGVKCVVAAKNPAKAENSVDYKGGEVYFCCKNCPKAFAKNPEKFSTSANKQLVATKQAKQEKCPISGRDLNPEQTTKVAGVEVTFCCPNCKGKVAKAEGEEQLILVFSDKAFEKAYKVGKEKEEK